ncbi:MAG: tRNA (adenosine(37)-N6)-threonylcarbamoyltransferase complex transferase subunit TsaD [bacterium]
MLILGIETSCDETAAAVVRDGRTVLSNVVFSQVAKHAQHGGVVPEIAARCHVEALPGIIEQAMKDAAVRWDEIDAVAATRGPGLASSLLIGLTAGRALAMTLRKPFIGVNHLEGHVRSIFLSDNLLSSIHYPLLVLLVSGGHTMLISAGEDGRFKLLGYTLDDAAGEALDKGAKLMGLGYPGGPAIELAASGGNPAFHRFPRGLEQNKHGGLNFSFSGLKTALLYYIKANPRVFDNGTLRDVAASYQEAVFDALTDRSDRAIEQTSAIVFACVGGVACNKRLRAKLEELAARRNVKLIMAKPEFCTDNAAMIAGAAGAMMAAGKTISMNPDVDPNLPLV